jgi:hypothetical protein
MTPYRISFFDADDATWTYIDYFIDISFGIDVVLNFFMAYYDSDDDIVDIRAKITCSYLKSWFMIDVISILPISQLMDTKNYS